MGGGYGTENVKEMGHNTAVEIEKKRKESINL